MRLKSVRMLMMATSLLILLAIVIYSNPSKLVSIFWGSRIEYVAMALAVSNVAVLVRVAKWKVLVNQRFADIFPVQLLGVTISTFSPGKIAEPGKAVILKMKTGTGVAETLQSIVWERLLDIIILLFLAFFVLQLIAVSGKLLAVSLLSVAVFGSLIVLLCAVLRSKKAAYMLLPLLKRLPVVNKIDSLFIENFYKKKPMPGRIGLSFLLTLSAWLLDGLVFSLAFRSIGISLSPLFLAGLLALSTLVGILSFLPGGIGSVEITMLFLLTGLGIENSAAFSGILLSRFLSVWYVVFLGGLSFLYLSRKIDLKSLFR